jgi:DNA polymerase IV (DinB-like DNA polymerase)
MTEKKRIIFHIDMDHFYTAVEERERPELHGKPVIVGADPKGGRGRGVALTSNYEARKFGVRSGMPISRAWKIIPEAVYLQPNFELYVRVSNEIMSILRSYSSKFEQWGIDEAFLDATSRVKDYAEAEHLAQKIKNEICEKQKLTCSIGIGPNKLVAKIASDYKKPDGLTIVKHQEAEAFLAPLPARKLLWVGRKTEQKLASIGIKTIGELAHSDPAMLADTFGVVGPQFYLMAHGIDRSEVEERSQIKSISRETTFEEDTSNLNSASSILNDLAAEVAKDSQDYGYHFRTVTIKIRYENFETHTYSKTLPTMTNRLEDLRKTASELMHIHVKPDRKMRLVGIECQTLPHSKSKRPWYSSAEN